MNRLTADPEVRKVKRIIKEIKLLERIVTGRYTVAAMLRRIDHLQCKYGLPIVDTDRVRLAIKKEEGHTSLDSVVRTLLMERKMYRYRTGEG